MLFENDESNSDSEGEEKQLLSAKTPDFQMNKNDDGGWSQKESLMEEQRYTYGQSSDSDVS